ncbi:MAG: oligoendopeptidase F [Verrucomicrobia bacterium]|nr:oligoendopeptidase F [Verrucomicrobiota bacterium]
MPTPRKEIAEQDRWNLNTLYPSLEAWQKELKSLVTTEAPPFFPAASAYKGKLGQSANNVQKALQALFEIERKLRKLYTYAHLLHDEETTVEEAKKAYQTIVTLYHQFSQETAWLTPEFMSLDDATLASYLKDPLLKEYHFFLEKMVRLKPHTLSESAEELMALAGQALESSQRTFSAINNSDFKFGMIKDSAGNEHELTHATFGMFLRDTDRELRKNAFLAMHRQYQMHENSLCEMLSGNVQSHLFEARARNYSSCVEAALYPKNVDVAVYRALIDAVHSKIDLLHRYTALRKKVLGLDELHYYDLYVPMVPSVDLKFSYDEAENLVINSMKPLGEKYVSQLHEGLKTGRWVDRYENENKRSGAYSSGCYDSMPYILMNYKGILRDVFTLAHEAGHSMHSQLARTSQPYHYADYAIFVAEVASTFNEEFLMQTLVEKATSDAERAYLLNEKLEDIRGTLFRQVSFAEFELFIHECAEKRIPLTPQLLKDKYLELTKFYYGPALTIDPEVAIEWARIPHFYYNFYVYQYATGISAALSLAEGVRNEGQPAVDRYLNFLRSGSSEYPIEQLAKAGVDMRKPEPVLDALEEFENYINKLEANLAVVAQKC